MMQQQETNNKKFKVNHELLEIVQCGFEGLCKFPEKVLIIFWPQSYKKILKNEA